MPDKIKITQKEIDDIYQIEEITEETMASPETATQEIPKEDTTPLLTEEEQEQEDEYLKDYQIPEDAIIGN